MTRRVGRIELAPVALPPMWTHAQWCAWLRLRGCLAAGHSMCVKAERCVAHETPVPAWRSNKHG